MKLGLGGLQTLELGIGTPPKVPRLGGANDWKWGWILAIENTLISSLSDEPKKIENLSSKDLHFHSISLPLIMSSSQPHRKGRYIINCREGHI